MKRIKEASDFSEDLLGGENILRIKKVMGLLSEDNSTESDEIETFPKKNKAYHVAPDIYIENIKKFGLTPKTESKKANHTERIYLFLNPESNYNYLASDLWHSSKYKEQVKNYFLLEIDLTKIPEHKFYNDLESSLTYASVYTKQPIPASAIKIIKTLPTIDMKPFDYEAEKTSDDALSNLIKSFQYNSEEKKVEKSFWDELANQNLEKTELPIETCKTCNGDRDKQESCPNCKGLGFIVKESIQEEILRIKELINI